MPAAADIIGVNPRATYLHANSDPALNAVPIDLATFGIQENMRIRLRRMGDFDCGTPCGDDALSMIAVFSSSSTLLPNSELHRVPGALDAGADIVTVPTFNGNEPTDIPEDFLVADASGPVTFACVTVPAGATHLFVSTHDAYFGDNTDPDGDFGVELEVVHCLADLNGDDLADGRDVRCMAECLITATSPSCGGCACADFDSDLGVEMDDLTFFVEALLTGNQVCP